MTECKISPFFSIEDLDRELIAREAQSLAGRGFNLKDEEGALQQTEIFRQVEALYHPSNVPLLNPALNQFIKRRKYCKNSG